jgi:hypothetical protein
MSTLWVGDYGEQMNNKLYCIKCHSLIYPHEEINGLCKYCRLKIKEDKNETRYRC